MLCGHLDLNDGSRVALHGECTELGKAQQYSQMVNSFWITYEKEFENELTLTALIGTAAIDNLNFQKDQSDQYYRLSLGVKKRF